MKDCLPPCKTIFVAFTSSEKNLCDLRDIFCQKIPKGHTCFSQNAGWKVYWYQHPDNSSRENRNVGFKSLTAPPYNEELNAFEQDMHDMISNIKFRDINDSFR